MNIQSLAYNFVGLPKDIKKKFLDSLTDAEAQELTYYWAFWARPAQMWPRGDWRTWLVLAGRGFGKTRVGAETVKECAYTKKYKRIGIIARTAADVRDTMIEGESGILAVCPPTFKPVYNSSKRRLTFPNGVIATTYSAEEPDTLRGPQHDFIWSDELAAWKYKETYDMAMFGLRLGSDPRHLITTTPRPIAIIRELLKDPTTFVTRGSTYDNLANLAPQFADQIVKKYEGTRLGRQELYAEVLDDVPGALWNHEMIDSLRIPKLLAPTDYDRIVVSIDPAVTHGEDADETGIVVVGRKGDDGYVLADRTFKGSSAEWAKMAVDAYLEFEADIIVAETNNGGDLVEDVIQNYCEKAFGRRLPVKQVKASRGKVVRAEPCSLLYEQGRFHHVGVFPTMEDQMCQFTPTTDFKAEGWSPDHVDPLVWASACLFETPAPAGGGVKFEEERPAAFPGIPEYTRQNWRPW